MLRYLSVVFLLCFMSVQAFAGTTGKIKGAVRDKTSGEPLAGVTVVAKSPTLLGEKVALTDEKGQYFIADLTPGSYSVTALFAQSQTQQKNIEVWVDQTLEINLSISSEATGEVYTIEESAPNVDIATATTGRRVDKDYLKNVPLSRELNLLDAVSLSPSAQRQGGRTDANYAFGGATYNENQYLVDGFSVTDPSLTLLNSRVSTEIMDNFEIKEAGYGPEFGRSTGAVINVVTKSGSNDFHGTVWGVFQPKLFTLDARSTASRSALKTSTDINYYLNAGVEVGGPIVKDLLWFHTSYVPELKSNKLTRKFQAIKVNDANQADRTITGQLQWIDTGKSDTWDDLSQSHQYTFKLTHLISKNMRHVLSARGAPIFHDGYGQLDFQADSAYGTQGAGNAQTFKVVENWGGEYIAGGYNFLGDFFDRKFKVEGTLGFSLISHQNQLDPVQDVPRMRYQNQRITDVMAIGTRDPNEVDPASIAECQPDADYQATPTTRATRCPIAAWVSQGFGRTDHKTEWRFHEKLKFTTLFNLAGLHQVVSGLDFEQVNEDNERHYSGGSQFNFNNTTNEFSLERDAQRDANGQNQIIDPRNDRAANFNFAAFLGDSWSPLSNVVLNYGVRWDAQMFTVPKIPTDRNSLHTWMSIWDNLAPRAGFVWDFTSKGRGALRFNYGRYYSSAPTSLPILAAGGAGTRTDFYDANKCGENGWNDQTNLPNGAKLTPLQVTDPSTQCSYKRLNDAVIGGSTPVLPGAKGGYHDEFVVSAEWEPFSKWIFGVTGTYRSVSRFLDSIVGSERFAPSTTDQNIGLVGNPGEFDMWEMDQVNNALNQTTDPFRRRQLEQVLRHDQTALKYPPPYRNYYSLEFKVDKRLSDHFAINASYVLMLQSYSGVGFPSFIQNITSYGDTQSNLLNDRGYGDSDQRHRVKAGGFYKASLKDFGVNVPLGFTVGTQAYVISGIPTWVFASDIQTGTTKVISNANTPRIPWSWNVDLNVGLSWDFSDAMSLEVFGRFYNIFNTKEPGGASRGIYVGGNAEPIVEGTMEDLPHVRSINANNYGQRALPSETFGEYSNFKAPFGAQIGARFLF